MQRRNVTQKLIASHLVDGSMTAGEEISLRIDQTLTQDATGTLVMLALEAMDIDQIKTETSVQYVDHNLIQQDNRNPEDHLFLQSACERFGLWFSRPGNGVSHPLHQQIFGIPGKTLLGSDSHTPAAGAIGMLAIGAGGLDVAMAMAGRPFHTDMPAIWGVRLDGRLPDWVSAKDVILELLRRHDVDGGVGRVIEYFGPGVATLAAMDRHVICNMGTELGATTTLFASEQQVRRYLGANGRERDWQELSADDGADYDLHEEIDLSKLVPLIAMPSSPDNVVPVSEVAGEEIYQAYIGSSANPGYRDFAMAAAIVKGKRIHPHVSMDINPTTRGLLQDLVKASAMNALLGAGARFHQAGCNGCIGMGQAPATDTLSLRTVPRNFPGRSGTREDKVALVSPETAAASALQGAIFDPRNLDMPHPRIAEPANPTTHRDMFIAPPSQEANATSRRPVLIKGPNIKPVPEFEPLPDALKLPVLLKLGDNISTDEIMPAGTRVLPYRSNIPAISQFVFEQIDERYPEKALEAFGTGHAIVAGENYGQGSSREHAALAPRYLGLRAVLAKGFGRIHRRNLINCGILPLQFAGQADYESTRCGDSIRMTNLPQKLRRKTVIEVINQKRNTTFTVHCELTSREVDVLGKGGLFNWARER